MNKLLIFPIFFTWLKEIEVGYSTFLPTINFAFYFYPARSVTSTHLQRFTDDRKI